MPLRAFGECFKLTCHKEVMPYNIYTYENVSMGAASIQSALDILNDDDKQQFLDNLEKWDCIKRGLLGNGMFDLIKYSSILLIQMSRKPGAQHFAQACSLFGSQRRAHVANQRLR